MMYNVQFLPIAREDLMGIAGYISEELGSPRAAMRLIEKIVAAADGLADFPYAYPVYIPIRPTLYEYRKMRVENYLVFYSVAEAAKTVTVMRIIYAKRDFEKLI